MRQDDAKTQLLELWSQGKKPWPKGDHSAFYRSADQFFKDISDNRSELLEFKSTADKWQVIKGWINEFENYPDC
jgi:hypothetical protein